MMSLRIRLFSLSLASRLQIHPFPVFLSLPILPLYLLLKQHLLLDTPSLLSGVSLTMVDHQPLAKRTDTLWTFWDMGVTTNVPQQPPPQWQKATSDTTPTTPLDQLWYYHRTFAHLEINSVSIWVLRNCRGKKTDSGFDDQP